MTAHATVINTSHANLGQSQHGAASYTKVFDSRKRRIRGLWQHNGSMTLRKAQAAAGLPDFTCHLGRHFFVSSCVMAGIDFMTIARWVGHKDGGVLIGKVYDHLSNEHAQRQAQKLEF
jgi:integrase